MKKHIIISGKVQGVGFRYWLYKAAIRRKINGWVKNKICGDVACLIPTKDQKNNITSMVAASIMFEIISLISVNLKK